MIRALLRSIRPRQWVKNLFVGAPVLFGQKLSDGHAAVRAGCAVAIFCMISSAVYLWNDLIDVEKDRVHPRKRNRPIASGALPVSMARAFAALFATLGVTLAWLLDHGFAAAATGYLALNVVYSLWLKRIAYVDVLTIATCFLLRVYAGALAVDVRASRWLLLCTALLACFLGFGKRVHELETSGARGGEQRAVLSSYRALHLRWALRITGVLTFFAYTAYTLSESTREFFHTTRMIWTAPAIAVGVTRFWTLVDSRPTAESPTEEMLRDPPFVANLFAYVIAVVAIIYFARG